MITLIFGDYFLNSVTYLDEGLRIPTFRFKSTLTQPLEIVVVDISNMQRFDIYIFKFVIVWFTSFSLQRFDLLYFKHYTSLDPELVCLCLLGS